MNAHNIYIHVPYCVSKCKYCAFFSRPCATPDWDAYADGIINEILIWRNRLGQIDLPTIFFGGGTPSLMPTNTFNRIMTALRQNFNINPDAEITIEANPGTINAQKLSDFMHIGMNRLSVGVQSLDDADLEFLGRIHTANDARAIIDIAQGMPIKLSADFIYGLPNWGVDSVKSLCREINSLGLQHCSLYELTIEADTPFAKMNLNMPNNDTMADMYYAIADTLSIPRYEVSNYAAAGNECIHNMNVWDGEPYIGLGTGAAGRVFMNDVWYEQTGGINGTFAPINENDRALEKVITGLRTTNGVRLTPDVKEILNQEYVEKHRELLSISSERLRATTSGILILDDLLIDLTKEE